VAQEVQLNQVQQDAAGQGATAGMAFDGGVERGVAEAGATRRADAGLRCRPASICWRPVGSPGRT